MKLTRTAACAAIGCAMLCLQSTPPARAQSTSSSPNLLSWGAGALIVQAPPSYSDSGDWSPDDLLDELPNTGWATKSGDLTPKVFVFELAVKSQIVSLGFDTAHVENRGRGAKDVKVEISDTKDGGFAQIASLSLAPVTDHQIFPLKTPAAGRYLRLTVLSNWGDSQYMEIMDVYAYGKPLMQPALRDNSGTFSSDYGSFHMQQTGATVNGCYEHSDGLIENGGFQGRVLLFTWSETGSDGSRHGGPAMLIFADDGQSFKGFWWNGGGQNSSPSGGWNGKRTSKDVGSCPYWKPGSGNAVEAELESNGRAALYGILFDTDSDHLQNASKPTLDALVATAHDQPSWNFSIEGHTDNTGSEAHNQTLSEKRAAAVKVYLVAAGVDAGRLTTQGFGSTRPVASNDTALGRSQNRRVEIVKK
jgi:OmpA-OmpF porin, OOP family